MPLQQETALHLYQPVWWNSWQPSGFGKANEMGIPSLTVTNLPGSTLSREAQPLCFFTRALKLLWHQPRSIRRKSQPLPSLQKAVGEGKPQCQSASLWPWFMELSIVAQSIESTLSEKENIDAKVRDLLETTQMPFTSDVSSRLLWQPWKPVSQTPKDFLHPMWRLCGRRNSSTEPSPWLKKERLSWPSLSDPVLANHTRGNIQEVAARGAKVLTIAEENVAKDTDDIVPYDRPPHLTNFNGRANAIGRLFCNTPPWTRCGQTT